MRILLTLLISMVFGMASRTCCIASAPPGAWDDPMSHSISASDPDSLIALAKTYIGIPYRYGGCSPEGFDCSGFVHYVFNKIGMLLPRSSPELAHVGQEVSLEESCKGDIILFAGSSPAKRPIGHAGIIISDPGEPLRFIHSATSNRQGIVISALEGYEYFEKRFVKVVRVLSGKNEP